MADFNEPTTATLTPNEKKFLADFRKLNIANKEKVMNALLFLQPAPSLFSFLQALWKIQEDANGKVQEYGSRLIVTISSKNFCKLDGKTELINVRADYIVDTKADLIAIVERAELDSLENNRPFADTLKFCFDTYEIIRNFTESELELKKFAP